VITPGTWTFSLAAYNVSTIQYKGDENAGGYDACCDFVANGNCTRRPPPPTGGQGGPAEICAPGEGGCSSDNDRRGGAAARAQLGPEGKLDWDYASHDCPLPADFSAAVSRPLHRMEAGRWALTLALRGPTREELACIAAAFEVQPGELNVKAAKTHGGGGVDDGGAGAGEEGTGADGANGGDGEGGGESSAGAGSGDGGGGGGGGAVGEEKLVGPVSFEFVRRGLHIRRR
jgi:hypothetical protein